MPLYCFGASTVQTEFLAGRCQIISEKAGFELCTGICSCEAELTTAYVAQDVDDLFSFMNSARRQAAGSPVARQVKEFRESESTSLLSLKDYPQVARTFVKANSTLPSNAAVERLFSIAGMILGPRQCKILE